MIRSLHTGLAGLLMACFVTGLQAQQGLRMPETAAPTQQAPASQNWGNTEWQALLDSARHRMGFFAYEFKWSFSASEDQARRSRLRDWSRVQTVAIANLLDAPEGLRVALLNLDRPNQTSEPFAYVHSGTPGWAVVRLVRRSSAEPLRPGPAFEASALRWIRRGTLPQPEALLADPAERARAAYWKARTPEDVAAIDPAWTPNLTYGDYFTPLTLAILRRDRPMAEALLARGASLTACSPSGCPLGIAVLTENAASALEWTQWLLGKGAPVDAIDPRFPLGNTTALALSMIHGHAPVVEALLAAGASPDGVPGIQITPIEIAAESGHRPLVELLLGRGASALPLPDRGVKRSVSRGNLYTAAKRAGKEEFSAWAAQTMTRAAQASGNFRYGAFIEQGKRRLELKDGAQLTLKAAPFQLVLQLPPGQADAVQFGASFSAAWMEEVRRQDRRNPMFNQFTSAALAEPPSPDSYDLLVGRPCPAEAKPDVTCPGANWHLGRDGSQRKDFHEVRAAANEYVREVRAIYDVSQEDKASTQPLAGFAGQTLHLVTGVTLDLDGAENRMEIINPRFIRIRFEK